MDYPCVNHKVIISAIDKKNESTISSKFFRSKYFEYEIAYKKAAEILIDKAVNDGDSFLCIAVYPIMFLYRQFFELYIKDILLRFDSEFDAKNKPYNKHDIYDLWKRLFEIVKDNLICFPQEIKSVKITDILAATDSYIKEISIIDQNSMAFRYPDDKTHTKPFFSDEVPVDLMNLKKRLEELANVLCLIEEVFIYIKVMKESL